MFVKETRALQNQQFEQIYQNFLKETLTDVFCNFISGLELNFLEMNARPRRPYNQKKLPNNLGLTHFISVACLNTTLSLSLSLSLFSYSLTNQPRLQICGQHTCRKLTVRVYTLQPMLVVLVLSFFLVSTFPTQGFYRKAQRILQCQFMLELLWSFSLQLKQKSSKERAFI